MNTTTKNFTAAQITEMHESIAAWEAGEDPVWPKRNERSRWELPNGKSYTNSGQAFKAMRKAIAAS